MSQRATTVDRSQSTRLANVLSRPPEKLFGRERILDGKKLRYAWTPDEETVSEMEAAVPGMVCTYVLGMTTTEEHYHVPEPVHQDHERLNCEKVFLLYLTPAKLAVYKDEHTLDEVLEFQANEGIIIDADTWHAGVDTDSPGRELIVMALIGERDGDSEVLYS